MKETRLEIHILGHPILRKRSQAVKRVDVEERQLFDKMLQLMDVLGGVGLAAPQAGIGIQLLVVRIQDTVLRLANPRIVHGSGREWAEEGCLSVPGVNVKVPRFTQVEVKAIDPDNQEILFTAQGLLARVIQHEIDHLKGRLIVDYLPWYKRIMVKVKVRKARQ